MQKLSEEPRNFCIVGPSGSGKSFCSLALARIFSPRKTVVVNGSADGFPDGEEATFEDLPSELSRVCYVLEDVQNLEKKDREAVFRLLNVTSRQLDSEVHVITHSIWNTGVFSLLPFFTHVVFTSEKINLRQLSQLLKHYLYPDKKTIERIFLGLKKRQYLVLRPRELTFEVANSDMAGGRGSHEEKFGVSKDTLLRYLSHLPDGEAYPSLIDFVLEIVTPGAVRTRDLSVELVTARRGKVRISLLDYLHVLNTAGAVPPRDVRLLHDYIRRKACFPSVLVKNRALGGRKKRERKKEKKMEKKAESDDYL